MSALSAPLPATHHCGTRSFGEAIAVDLRTRELEPLYGYRLAHEIAHRERWVFNEEQAAELREWAERERAHTRGAGA